MYSFNSFYFAFLILYILYALSIRLLYQNSHNSSSKLWYIFLLFLPLFVLSAFRGEAVGGDLDNYIPAFQETSGTKSFSELMGATKHEPGYKILTRVIGFFSTDTRFFLIITAFVSLIGPFFLVYHFSSNAILSIVMYFTLGYYTGTFNNIRQSIAVSIFLIGIPYLIKKRFLLFSLIAFLSSMFHYSAIALFLIYPLVKSELSFKKIISILLIGVAVYVLAGSNIIYNIVMFLFLKYNPDSLDLSTSGAGWNLLILYCFTFFLLFSVYYANKRKIEEKQRRLMDVLLTLQLISIVFQLFATIYPSATRMGQYYFVPIIITVPYLFSTLRLPIYRYVYSLFFICYCTLFFYMVFSYSETTDSNTQGVIPYVFLDTMVF